MKKITKTEKYDAPWLVLDSSIMIDFKNEHFKSVIHENEGTVNKLLDSDNTNYKKMLNIFFTKKVKEDLESQEQFDKINIILENPLDGFMSAKKQINESIETMKKNVQDFKKAMQKKGDEIKIPIREVKMSFSNYLKEQDIYKQAYKKGKNNSAFIGLYPTEEELETHCLMLAMEEEVEKKKSAEYYLKNVIGTYIRVELTIRPQIELKVYIGGAPFYSLEKKDFRPWDFDGTEIYYGGYDEKSLMKKLYETSLYRDEEEKEEYDIIELLQTLSNMHEKLELIKKIEEKVGVCPYNQLTFAIAKMVKDAAPRYPVVAMAFLLQNNVIREQVEKTRIIVPNNSKKSTKKIRYKSVVKTYFDYDESLVGKLIKKTNENIGFEEKMQEYYENLKEERNYTQQEWESSSYYRRGKNGEKIKVSGSKKRRKKTLLQKRIEEKLEDSNSITLGISKREAEKIIENKDKI